MDRPKGKIWTAAGASAIRAVARRLAVAALPVVLAALVGAGLGVGSAMVVLPGAPALPAMTALVESTPAPAVVALIDVEPLAAPLAPVPDLVTPGEPHLPALYALLLESLERETKGTAMAGAPHRLSDFAQLFWSDRLAAPVVRRITAGPAHKPAELAALFALGLFAEVTDDRRLPGPPHLPSELAMAELLGLPVEKNAGAMVAWTEKPGQENPGRQDERLMYPGQDALVAQSTEIIPVPHTMPEIVLLLAAQGTTRDVSLDVLPVVNESDEGSIALRSTWTLASLDLADLIPEEPARIAIAPVPGFKPEPPVAPDVTVRSVVLNPLVLDPAVDGTPLIAIMIDDLGINEDRARLMSALPGPLTLAFMPYGEDVAALAEIAADAGHELFLHLPMQPMDDTVDPGPHALMGDVDPDEFQRQLLWNLRRFDGYVGVNNHMGSSLTQDPEAMELVMAELGSRNLMFVDSLTAPSSVAYGTARRFGMPAVRRDLFIDHVAERDAILAQLRALEGIALQRGFALGIGHPYDITAEVLAEWLPSVQARGFRLVPVSTIVEANEFALARPAAE